MDYIKIGRFIAERRKLKNLTQKQFADILYISDKTVSKWECGKGLPEVSLMLPLCNALDITVNELLFGERISADDYKGKAEKNIMNLVEENSQNKKMLLQSVVCGVNTVIAVCSLILLVSFVHIPVAVRVLLIIIAIIIAVMGIGVACAIDRKTGYFRCPECKQLFVPEMSDYVKGTHTFTKRKLTCPFCGKKSMCRHIITK